MTTETTETTATEAPKKTTTKKATSKKATSKRRAKAAPINKAAFVRKFDEEVPAKKIVEAAAKKGVEITDTYVYAVRAYMRAKSKKVSAKKVSTKNASAKKVSTKNASRARGPRGPRAGSKRAFVLGLPKDMSAKDVIETAATKGIQLTAAYVYAIRSAAKGQSGPKAPAAAPPAPTSDITLSGNAAARELAKRAVAQFGGFEGAAEILSEAQAMIAPFV
jgi:hypothetical protein